MRFAAIPVVPLPQNGSNTQSPLMVEAKSTRTNKANVEATLRVFSIKTVESRPIQENKTSGLGDSFRGVFIE